MSKKSNILPESSNRARVSPYPLRSSRKNKYKAPESLIQSKWEDVRCVICMEPPHNAVLLRCSSSINGCRTYMCDTSARHSNCLKQFRKKNKMKRSNTTTLNCPLCRGEVFETTKVTSTASRFMNAKPRSCPIDDCGFSGTYSQLDKHLKTEHRGLIPPQVDQQRQCRWEQMERHAEYVELMSAAGIQHFPEVVHHQFPHTHHLPVFRVNIVNGTVRTIIGPVHVRNGFGATNYAAAHIPRLQFRPMSAAGHPEEL